MTSDPVLRPCSHYLVVDCFVDPLSLCVRQACPGALETSLPFAGLVFFGFDVFRLFRPSAFGPFLFELLLLESLRPLSAFDVPPSIFLGHGLPRKPDQRHAEREWLCWNGVWSSPKAQLGRDCLLPFLDVVFWFLGVVRLFKSRIHQHLSHFLQKLLQEKLFSEVKIPIFHDRDICTRKAVVHCHTTGGQAYTGVLGGKCCPLVLAPLFYKS